MHYLQPYIDTIVTAFVGLAVTAMLAGVATLRVKLNAVLAARLTMEERDVLHRLAKEGMALAEASFKAEGGPAKLEAAMQYVSGQLARLGIRYSAEAIQAAIEKAVLEFNTKTKPPDSAT